jgi:peptidoglycan hydrolase CwlO-like protein
MNVKIILAIAIFSTVSFAASAQTTTTAKPVSTIKNDRQRIRQGVKSGELTKAEAARLKAQTAKVNQERKDYKADGVVTTEERKDLRQDKKRLSRRIYKQKHDGQVRH